MATSTNASSAVTATITPQAPEQVLEIEFGGRSRTLSGWVGRFIYWLGITYVLLHLWALNVYPVDPWVLRTIHLSTGSIMGFAIYGARRTSNMTRASWFDWAAIALNVAIAGYILLNLDDLMFRAGVLPTGWDLVVGSLGTFLVLELTRRSAGLALPILALIFILYAFVGPWMPGVLRHSGITADIFFSYIYSMQGIHGLTLDVSATYLVLFVVFANFLNASKAGDFFNDLSVAVVGWARGGPAKVAVISGILFGTISGSSVANVVASGMITIPMMRRVGYDRATAAAIEATSSTGGQMTPPIMGAGAFLMAGILGIPYYDIAIAAIIPTLLFYTACYVHCDLHARKNDLRGIPRNELPRLSFVMRRFHLTAPIVVMVTLLIMGYSVYRAGSVGILAAIGATWLSNRADALGLRRIGDTLASAAREMVQLVAICACAGIIVGVIALTGLGGRFSSLVLVIAGESQLLALVFSMLIALILGMGMPTTAAYAIAASVVAPGLTKIGVEPLTAHLFIFYYAVMSSITPPVALASFAAAGLAAADPWRTSLIAIKLGLATFIVPFLFFFGPELLMRGETMNIILAFASASIGVFLLASSTEGWFVGATLGMLERVALFVFALCLMIPGLITDTIGLAGGIGIYLLQRYRRKPRPG